MDELVSRLREAVRFFWTSREEQRRRQGAASGEKDRGHRAAVTGGRQMGGFVRLLRWIVVQSGVDEHSVYTKRAQTVLPGFFRPTKSWDVVVVADRALLACIELKSQVGSFGNNFNNRVEEAIGSSVDLLTAYREGRFAPDVRPWLGWLMLLEDAPACRRPVRAEEPHFKVFAEFKRASYLQRYLIFCERLMRERLYDAACVLVSEPRAGARDGGFLEPDPRFGFRGFAASLAAHLWAYAQRRRSDRA